MRVHFGTTSLDLPDGYGVTSVVVSGPVDRSAAEAGGLPTIAKQQTRERQRILSIRIDDAEGEQITTDVLREALSTIKQATGGRVVNVEETEAFGRPAMMAEIHHDLDKGPVVTFAFLTSREDRICSLTLTVLEDAKAVKAARKDFDQLVDSFV